MKMSWLWTPWHDIQAHLKALCCEGWQRGRRHDIMGRHIGRRHGERGGRDEDVMTPWVGT